MALPKIMEDEVGRQLTITWYKEGGTTPEDLTALAITGRIETTPGPTFTVRAISGALAVLVGTDGTFTWTLNATDTATPGIFNVMFIATSGGNNLRTFKEKWEVERAPAAP